MDSTPRKESYLKKLLRKCEERHKRLEERHNNALRELEYVSQSQTNYDQEPMMPDHIRAPPKQRHNSRHDSMIQPHPCNCSNVDILPDQLFRFCVPPYVNTSSSQTGGSYLFVKCPKLKGKTSKKRSREKDSTPTNDRPTSEPTPVGFGHGKLPEEIARNSSKNIQEKMSRGSQPDTTTNVDASIPVGEDIVKPDYPLTDKQSGVCNEESLSVITAQELRDLDTLDVPLEVNRSLTAICENIEKKNSIIESLKSGSKTDELFPVDATMIDECLTEKPHDEVEERECSDEPPVILHAENEVTPPIECPDEGPVVVHTSSKVTSADKTLSFNKHQSFCICPLCECKEPESLDVEMVDIPTVTAMTPAEIEIQQTDNTNVEDSLVLTPTSSVHQNTEDEDSSDTCMCETCKSIEECQKRLRSLSIKKPSLPTQYDNLDEEKLKETQILDIEYFPEEPIQYNTSQIVDESCKIMEQPIIDEFQNMHSPFCSCAICECPDADLQQNVSDIPTFEQCDTAHETYGYIKPDEPDMDVDVPVHEEIEENYKQLCPCKTCVCIPATLEEFVTDVGVPFDNEIPDHDMQCSDDALEDLDTNVTVPLDDVIVEHDIQCSTNALDEFDLNVDVPVDDVSTEHDSQCTADALDELDMYDTVPANDEFTDHDSQCSANALHEIDMNLADLVEDGITEMECADMLETTNAEIIPEVDLGGILESDNISIREESVPSETPLTKQESKPPYRSTTSLIVEDFKNDKHDLEEVFDQDQVPIICCNCGCRQSMPLKSKIIKRRSISLQSTNAQNVVTRSSSSLDVDTYVIEAPEPMEDINRVGSIAKTRSKTVSFTLVPSETDPLKPVPSKTHSVRSEIELIQTVPSQTQSVKSQKEPLEPVPSQTQSIKSQTEALESVPSDSLAITDTTSKPDSLAITDTQSHSDFANSDNGLLETVPSQSSQTVRSQNGAVDTVPSTTKPVPDVSSEPPCCCNISSSTIDTDSPVQPPCYCSNFDHPTGPEPCNCYKSRLRAKRLHECSPSETELTNLPPSTPQSSTVTASASTTEPDTIDRSSCHSVKSKLSENGVPEMTIEIDQTKETCCAMEEEDSSVQETMVPGENVSNNEDIEVVSDPIEIQALPAESETCCEMERKDSTLQESTCPSQTYPSREPSQHKETTVVPSLETSQTDHPPSVEREQVTPHESGQATMAQNGPIPFIAFQTGQIIFTPQLGIPQMQTVQQTPFQTIQVVQSLLPNLEFIQHLPIPPNAGSPSINVQPQFSSYPQVQPLFSTVIMGNTVNNSTSGPPSYPGQSVFSTVVMGNTPNPPNPFGITVVNNILIGNSQFPPSTDQATQTDIPPTQSPSPSPSPHKPSTVSVTSTPQPSPVNETSGPGPNTIDEPDLNNYAPLEAVIPKNECQDSPDTIDKRSMNKGVEDGLEEHNDTVCFCEDCRCSSHELDEFDGNVLVSPSLQADKPSVPDDQGKPPTEEEAIPSEDVMRVSNKPSLVEIPVAGGKPSIAEMSVSQIPICKYIASEEVPLIKSSPCVNAAELPRKSTGVGADDSDQVQKPPVDLETSEICICESHSCCETDDSSTSLEHNPSDYLCTCDHVCSCSSSNLSIHANEPPAPHIKPMSKTTSVIFPSNTGPSKTESLAAAPSKTGPSKTESFAAAPSKTWPSKTESLAAAPSKTGPSQTESLAADPSKTGTSKTESLAAAPSKTGPSKTDTLAAASSKTGPSKTESLSAAPSKTGPSKTGSLAAAPSKTWPSKTESLAAAPSKTGPSQTESLAAAPSKTGPSKTESLSAAPSKTGSSKTESLSAAPSKTGPSKRVSLVAAPSKTGSSKTESLSAAPSKTGPSKRVSIVAAPSKTGLSKTESLVAAPSKTGPSKTEFLVATPSKMGPSKTESLEAFPAETVSSKPSSVFAEPPVKEQDVSPSHAELEASDLEHNKSDISIPENFESAVSLIEPEEPEDTVASPTEADVVIPAPTKSSVGQPELTKSQSAAKETVPELAGPTGSLTVSLLEGQISKLSGELASLRRLTSDLAKESSLFSTETGEEETGSVEPEPAVSAPSVAPPSASEEPPTTGEAPPTTSEEPPTLSEAPSTPSKAPPTLSKAPLTPSEAPPTSRAAPSQFLPESPSELRAALLSMQVKQHAKDQMIQSLAEELKLRAGSNVWEQLLAKVADPQGNPIDDFDRAHLASFMSRPKLPPLTQQRYKNLRSGYTAPNSGPPQEGVEEPFHGPISVKIVQRILATDLLVEWDVPENNVVVGYEVFVNGAYSQKVRSGDRHMTVLHNIDFDSVVKVTVYALTRHGRIDKIPGHATLNPPAEMTMKVTDYTTASY